MAGFRRQARTIVLHFTGELEGLEVRARSVSVGTITRMLELAQKVQGKLAPEDIGIIGELFGTFAAAVVSWNLEHEEASEVPGVSTWVPTPISVAGLEKHDGDFVLDMIMAWIDGAIGTPGETGKESDDGKPSVEASMPMDVS
jgi:hypothetical protein